MLALSNLTCEKIKNITERTSISFVKFSVFTLSARNIRELFILNIKDFRKCAASCTYFTSIILVMTTFYTRII